MAVKVISAFDSTRTTTSSGKSASGKAKYNLSVLRRLSTFNSSSEDMHRTLTKSFLAGIGFVHTGNNNIVKCDACAFEIESSKSASDLIEEHEKQSPQCQFVLHSSYSTNSRTNLLSISTSSQTNNTTLTSPVSRNHVSNTYENNSTPQKSFLNSLSEIALEKLRAAKFSNWPLITPNIQDMVTAGWCYTNIADRVICTHCDVLYHKWTESDRPYQIHRLKSPHCPFILANEKRTGPVSNTTARIAITTEPNVGTLAGPVHTNYSLSARRYESFQNWPHTDENPLPSIESFVDAGFYYTGEGKVVRCFYCDGGLRNWESGDDPKVEHARWYSQCAYIRQYLGEDLYQAIQRKNQELKAQQNSSNASWTQDEIDRMVKARLDLPVVEKLRQAGFSMAMIRKTFEMQLRFKKDDFKTDHDLFMACLILDQQVKLINGNEANILVPQDWLKKYIEDEEHGTYQPESQQQAQTLIKTIEIPSVTVPVVVRPTLTQKLDDESLPCLLCLTTERQVACLPCGHLTSCVACGHSLKTCPLCRATVKAFVRIYI